MPTTTPTTPPSPQSTLIPAGATLSGDVHAPGDAVIAGRLSGELRVAGRLTLAATGRVDGSIAAAHAALHGRAGADVTVRGQTELFPGATVEGVLSTAELAARDGARFQGRLVLGASATPAQPPQAPDQPVAAPAATPQAATPLTPVTTAPSTPSEHAPPVTPAAALSFTAVPGVAQAGLRLRTPAG